MNTTTKNCPNCHNNFILKRLNQKYCSDACRIQKNNERSRAFRELTKNTNHILAKNRQILSELEAEQLTEIELKIKGFKFGYVTNFISKPKSTEFICYDYGYRMIENRKGRVIEIFKL
jgi:predicted nucleic acid-binding Zn ribbon protein